MSRLLWFCDWLKKTRATFSTNQKKTKTNGDLFAPVFPRFTSTTFASSCGCLVHWTVCVCCDWSNERCCFARHFLANCCATLTKALRDETSFRLHVKRLQLLLQHCEKQRSVHLFSATRITIFRCETSYEEGCYTLNFIHNSSRCLISTLTKPNITSSQISYTPYSKMAANLLFFDMHVN